MYNLLRSGTYYRLIYDYLRENIVFHSIFMLIVWFQKPYIIKMTLKILIDTKKKSKLIKSSYNTRRMEEYLMYIAEKLYTLPGKLRILLWTHRFWACWISRLFSPNDNYIIPTYIYYISYQCKSDLSPVSKNDMIGLSPEFMKRIFCWSGPSYLLKWWVFSNPIYIDNFFYLQRN